MNNLLEERDALSAEANLVRSKLMKTVEALDRRRHDALDVGLLVRRHAAPLGVAAAVVVATLAGSVLLLAHRIATSKQRRRRERWRMLGRVWRHPERAARTSPSFFASLGRSIALGVLSFVVMFPAKRVTAKLLTRGESRARALTIRARASD